MARFKKIDEALKSIKSDTEEDSAKAKISLSPTYDSYETTALNKAGDVLFGDNQMEKILGVGGDAKKTDPLEGMTQEEYDRTASGGTLGLELYDPYYNEKGDLIEDNGDIVEQRSNYGDDDNEWADLADVAESNPYMASSTTEGTETSTESTLTPFQQMLEEYLSGDNSEFKFDLNGEELYQQYKDQYKRNGQLAMMDTMGQASALTGGYGSTYAQNAGQQAYQGYMNDLNAIVPDVYESAYSRWQDEREAELEKLNLYADYYGTGNTSEDTEETETQSMTDLAKEIKAWQDIGYEYDPETGTYYKVEEEEESPVVDSTTGRTENDLADIVNDGINAARDVLPGFDTMSADERMAIFMAVYGEQLERLGITATEIPTIQGILEYLFS